jgi:hypothetical protein
MVRVADLRAGDVLLLRSPGLVAWATRFFDSAEVDRAALYLGDGRVAEAVGDKVTIRSFDECTASAEQFLARRLKEHASMEPLLGRTEELLSAPASAAPEVQLALLCISRKPRTAPSLLALQRAALESGAEAITAPAPLTGAQFVWRCYEDALPEESDVYTVRLNGIHYLEMVSGVPMVPGAGVARRRGRGVHPDSVLTWAAQPAVRSRLGSARAGDAPPPLDASLARYREEVRSDVTVGLPERAQSDALLASLQKFASAWSGKSPQLAKGPLPPQLEMLFRSAADLCTAGDLLRSEDLFTL